MTSVVLTHNSPRGCAAVGGEVAEVRHVDQLVVEYRWAADLVIDQDDAVLGGAVAVDEVDVGELLDQSRSSGEMARIRSAPRTGAHQGASRAARHHLPFDDLPVGAVHGELVGLALHLLEQHLPDAGDEVELGGADQGEVVEEVDRSLLAAK